MNLIGKIDSFPELGNTIVIDGIEYVKKREPLSEKEILNLWANKSPANEFECVRLVEKAHGITGGK